LSWKDYLAFLGGSPYSMRLLTSSLAPEPPIQDPRVVRVEALNYELWPFQQKVLDKIGGDTLILGLPTGLGKTYLAGAYLLQFRKILKNWRKRFAWSVGFAYSSDRICL